MATNITSPTLVLDKKKCLTNIRRMSAKARDANARLRPHCKTHACLEIARWMREEGGVQAITVSSLSMAEYFSAEWDDITVAFPVNFLEIDTINRLASTIPNLNVLVENMEAITYLEEHLQNPVGVWVKIDCGYGRTGIPANDIVRIQPVLDGLQASQRMRFQGFLTHSGHTYHCRNKEEILEIHRETKTLLLELKERYVDDFPGLQLSVGDTPSCSVLDSSEFQDFDEIRPGNYVFYDLEQASIGSCSVEEISVAVACPIVAKHPQRNELIVYGGGVHFSKDRVSGQPEGTIFGRVVIRHSQTSMEWGNIVPGMYLKGISQEHGKVVVPDAVWDDYQVGDLLFVLPVHSCMTADVLKHKGYLTTEGIPLQRMTN
jgi:D-serine deaminase-like pyridoxal phosphate-dependent protein